MPYYDFVSDEGDVIEAKAKPDELTIERDGVVYRRVFSVPFVIYRGEGFYATDSADRITKWQRKHAQGEEPPAWV